MKNALYLIPGILFAALATFTHSVSALPTLWSGAAGDSFWSSGGNWSPAGIPGVSANVIFTNDGVALDTFTVNNILDPAFSSPSINALGYMNTNGFHNTHLNAELRVVSSSTTEVATTADDGNPYVFFVGGNQWQDDRDAVVYTRITGNPLVISNGNANFGVTQISAIAGAHRATLNLSDLDAFTCVVSNVLIGHNFTQIDHAWRPTGELFLARSNFITAKMMIVADAYQNAGATCYIHLGGINNINVDEIRIGMHKTIGVIDIVSHLANPFVTFRNAAGTGRQLFWKLGDEFDPNGTNYLFGFFTSNQARGTADLTGANVDALVDRIILGRGQIQFDATNRTGDGNGTLVFGGGIIDVNVIEMGIQVPGPFIGGSVGHGTLTVNNNPGAGGPALLIVRSNIVMAVQQAGAPTPDTIGSTGDITVNDSSTIAVAGDIISGGPGGGTATINLNNGGTLDMQPVGDATPGNVSINILNLGNGIITNYGTLSVTNINLVAEPTDFTVYPGQSIAPAGINKVGPLNVSGSLILLGTTAMDIQKIGTTLSSDSINATAVELGGTLKVSFPGAHTDLAPGDKFTLFTSVPLDSSLTLVLPPPGAGLVWANNIFLDGSIEVVPCGCGEPRIAPRLTVTASPASATVSWPLSYTSFVLRSQTNALGTNWGLVPGVANNSFTFPFQPGITSMFFHLIQQ